MVMPHTPWAPKVNGLSRWEAQGEGRCLVLGAPHQASHTTEPAVNSHSKNRDGDKQSRENAARPSLSRLLL